MSRTTKQRLDDKHEKLLRDESRKHGNNECFDCSQKGPFSIVIELGTFVCNDCAGIHRGSPFNHHIKSISTSSFKPEEVRKILKEGGNERANKIWLGKQPSNRKPRTGDLSKIRQYMELKYIKKAYYIPPEVALAADIPEEDLADTGILDQIPSPSGARRPSTSGREKKSLSQQANTQDPFAIGAPPGANDRSFFSAAETPTSFFPGPGTQNSLNNANNTSFFPSSSPATIETSKKQGNLLDIMSEPNSEPVAPTAQKTSLSSSLLDLDLGPSQTSNSFGTQQAFGQNNPLNGLDFGSSNSFGSVNPAQSSSSQDMFGLGSLNSTGMSSYQGQQQQFGSQGTGLFDSLAGTTNISSSNSFGTGHNSFEATPVPVKRASLFDDPVVPEASNTQNQNGSQQFRSLSAGNPMQPQGIFNQPIQQNNSMGQNMQIQPQQAAHNATQYQNQGQMNQGTPPPKQTQQTGNPTPEQLDLLQQQFIQKLKSLPAEQQKTMSTQYQQWNAQQRMQFLIKNFGQSQQSQQFQQQQQPQQSMGFQPQQQGMINQPMQPQQQGTNSMGFQPQQPQQFQPQQPQQVQGMNPIGFQQPQQGMLNQAMQPQQPQQFQPQQFQPQQPQQVQGMNPTGLQQQGGGMFNQQMQPQQPQQVQGMNAMGFQQPQQSQQGMFNQPAQPQQVMNSMIGFQPQQTQQPPAKGKFAHSNKKMFSVEEDNDKPMFGAESDEEEEISDEREGTATVVAYTVVEGEADEEEDDGEEEDNGEISTGLVYPGLQLPPKYRSSGLPESVHASSASESEGESEDYSSLFPSDRFGYTEEAAGQEYYFTSETQRKAAKQNIQMRRTFADKVVQILHPPSATFAENIGPSVAEGIIVAQDISQNIKNANQDLIALTELLADLKAFPTSLLA